MNRTVILSRLAILAVLTCAGASPAVEMAELRDPGTGRLFALKPTSTSLVARRTAGLGMSEAQAQSAAESFIASNAAVLSVRNPAQDLKLAFSSIDGRGNAHVRYQQVSGDIPVLGGGLTVHLGPGGEVTYVTVNIVEDVPYSVTPLLTMEEAMAQAVMQADRDIQFGLPSKIETISQPRGTTSLPPPSLDDLPVAAVPNLEPASPGGHAARQDPAGEAAVITPTAIRAELIIVAPGLIGNSKYAPSPCLAWRVPVQDAVNAGAFSVEYFVDASSGRVVFQQSLIDNLNRQVYDVARAPGDGTKYLDQTVTDPAYQTPLNQYTFGRSEGQPARGAHPGPDPNWGVTLDMGTTSLFLPYLGSNDVDNLYRLLGQMQDFTWEKFGQDGASGSGGTTGNLTPAIPHADNIADGNCPANASYQRYWGNMYFCLGMVTPDVVGHEYAHALSEFWTGGMSYGESGALNEALSDVVGEAFESYSTGMLDWISGTGVFWGRFRNLESPWKLAYGYDSATGRYSLFPDRFCSPRLYCGSGDSYGVHRNSTVVSHAFHVAAMGDQRNCDVAAIGLDAAVAIMAEAMRYYITWDASFLEAYSAFLQAATGLFGDGSFEYVNMQKALQSVQLDRGGGYCSGQPDPGITCMVRSAWAPITTRPDGTPTTVFAPRAPIGVKGRGIPGRTINLRVKYANANRVHNSDILASPVEATATVGADSTFAAVLVFTPPDFQLPLGNFDLILDGNGDYTWEAWSDTLTTFQVVAATSVEGAAPSFAMGTASPNPAEGDLSLNYHLGQAGNVRVAVYDVRGRLVAEPALGWQEPGPQAVIWNGRMATGGRVAAGVYFLRVSVDGQDKGMRKVMVLR